MRILAIRFLNHDPNASLPGTAPITSWSGAKIRARIIFIYVLKKKIKSRIESKSIARPTSNANMTPDIPITNTAMPTNTRSNVAARAIPTIVPIEPAVRLTVVASARKPRSRRGNCQKSTDENTTLSKLPDIYLLAVTSGGNMPVDWKTPMHIAISRYIKSIAIPTIA